MSDKNSDSERIRGEVARAYGEAIRGGSGCCGTQPGTPQPGSSERGGCCGNGIPTTPVAQLAGYRIEELARLPQGLAQSSFGCGNPLAFGEVEPGQVVLDLGSGAGLDLLLAAQRVGPGGRVIGVDMTDEMIARARTHIEAAGLTDTVEVRRGIIEELPVESGTVDWVISNCVINLSPEKPRVFSEIARVLRPGGRISISDIVVEHLPDWVRQSAAAYSACIAGAISEADYLQGLRDAGLEAVRVAERLVYQADQLSTMVEADEPTRQWLATSGLSFEQAIGAVAGNVWSAKFTGRKPIPVE